MTKRQKYVVTRLGLLALFCYVYAFLIYRANADDYVSLMLGTFNSAIESRVETKFANVGHRGDLGLGLSYQYEVGGWIDNTGNGRGSSGYGAYQIGVEAKGPLTARFMSGPSLITGPDIYLGGPFQFTEDLYLGIAGDNGNSVGLKYKHFSSAGFELPNIGRDFIGLEIGVRW